MTTANRFSYKTLDELKSDVAELNVQDKLKFSDNVDVLLQPLKLNNGLTLANRFVIHPMEGFDATPIGAPDKLAFRRYERYARGGNALIWFEACAVLHEARSNPCQLWINDQNWKIFRDLVANTKRVSRECHGFEPVCVLQLTHSGRYSRPHGYPQPIIAHHSKYLDPIHHLDDSYPLVTDDYLDNLQDVFAHAAVLAEKAGFDGVDLKGCHRYLMAEIHASYTREGKYGGEALKNRTRMMRETLAKIKAATSRIFVTTRINATDEMPYPYGFGMDKSGALEPDLSEIIELIGVLRTFGMPFINITIANPYFEPFYGRPFDTPVIGTPASPEHPIIGVARFLNITAQIQHAVPDFPIIGTGYSWLRQFAVNAAAASIEANNAQLIGFGRASFAYPDMPADLRANGCLNPQKCCMTCSRCTQIMRDGAHTGCVIRDAQTYSYSYKLSHQFATDKALVKQALAASPDGIDNPVRQFLAAYAKGDLYRAIALRPTGARNALSAEQCTAASVTVAPETRDAVFNAPVVLTDYARMCGIIR